MIKSEARKMQAMSQAEVEEMNGNGGGSRVCKCRKCGCVVQATWLGKLGHDLHHGHKGDWYYYDLW